MEKNYEILYENSFPMIKYNLKADEKIKAEANAMISMSATIDVTGNIEGGLAKGIGRMLSGEKVFFQYMHAARGDGEVLLAHTLPGGIVDIQLDGNTAYKVQKDGFLAATENVNLSATAQNLKQGLLSGEGFFVLKAGGIGVLFVSSYGAIHKIELEAGEERVIDSGHLVAWADHMTYTLEKASKTIISSIASGESWVCRFTGPGTVYIQTRNQKMLFDSIVSHARKS